MLLTTEAYALIRKAIFRIPIEPAAEDDWWWGTGFFISPDGYALTAFHNLPANVIAQGKGELVGILRDGAKIPFRYIPSKGDKRRDIAVLKARARRKGAYPYLPPAVLDAELRKTIDPSSINQSNIVGILAFEPEVDHQELFRAIQEHIDFSADRIRRRCYYSVWLCGHLRIEESLDDVVKATKHAFGSVRNCASEALGKMGIRSASVISALEERLLEDQYYRARYHAAWSLGELKSTNSLAKLDAAIKDEEVLDVKQEMIRVWELLVR